MDKINKIKIGLFSHSDFILRNYWCWLRDRAECAWGTTNPTLARKLRYRHGYHCILHDVYYVPERLEGSSWIHKIANQYLYRKRNRSAADLMDIMSPDLWVLDTFTIFAKIEKKVPWVQVFHSLPFKEYFFHSSLHKYDLILLPGEYHKREIKRRLGIEDKKLRVVGWPRIDALFNEGLDRETILRNLGLNAKAKTIMYAPTYGQFRWTYKEFEYLCEIIAKMGLNFIVRLHSQETRIIRNKRFEAIAKSYGALLIPKEVDYCMEDNNCYLWVTDVLISDVSGAISDYMVLDRPVIFIEPKKWEDFDMPRDYRKGIVVNKCVGEVIKGIEKSLKNPDEYGEGRREFVREVFHKLDGKAIERATDAIMEFIK